MGGNRRAAEGGFALPSWVALVSLAVVAVAVIGFFVTGPGEPGRAPSPLAAQGATDGPSDTPTRAKGTPTGDKDTAPPVRKPGDPQDRQPPTPSAYVEVYNNSTVPGLAAQAASELQDAGWNVVGTDNWYGNIPGNTVYYPDRLREQARLLARDLGVERVRPAVSPMRFDRLTVILTAAA